MFVRIGYCSAAPGQLCAWEAEIRTQTCHGGASSQAVFPQFFRSACHELQQLFFAVKSHLHLDGLPDPAHTWSAAPSTRHGTGGEGPAKGPGGGGGPERLSCDEGLEERGLFSWRKGSGGSISVSKSLKGRCRYRH